MKMSEKIHVNVRKNTDYASRLWISVIAGTCLALEKGFHLLISSHQPETVSPKFLGELSSSYYKSVRCVGQ
jgi:hypothetical protein